MIKKKIMAGLLGTGIVLVGTNVYATTVLDTNIVSLIKNAVTSLGNFYTTTTTKEVADTKVKYQGDISTYVDNKATEVVADMENTKKSEVERAKKELDAHYQELTEATNQVVEQETTKVKTQIKADVDKEITNVKNEMDKKLEEKIKELQTKWNNGNGNAYGHDNN